MSMKYIVPVLFLAMSASAGRASSSAGDGVKAQWIDSTALRLSFVLSEGDGMGSDYAVFATPRLV